jgi:hypothetical protein
MAPVNSDFHILLPSKLIEWKVVPPLSKNTDKCIWCMCVGGCIILLMCSYCQMYKLQGVTRSHVTNPKTSQLIGPEIIMSRLANILKPN